MLEEIVYFIRGRITLIKVAFSNIPVYYMSIFKMLAKIVEVFEKYRREFWWNGGRGEEISSY